MKFVRAVESLCAHLFDRRERTHKEKDGRTTNGKQGRGSWHNLLALTDYNDGKMF